jgi:hypothetical protein
MPPKKDREQDPEFRELLKKAKNLEKFDYPRLCIKEGCDNSRMKLTKRSTRGRKKMAFRCPKCRTLRTILSDTFLELFKKSGEMVLELLKYWAISIPILKIVDKFDIDNEIEEAFDETDQLDDYESKRMKRASTFI